MKYAILTLIISIATIAAKPNIVFILSDDMGYGDLSCYGQKNFQTPAIDALAAQGLRFTDHYSGATVCAPSRACLMTGKHTGQVVIRGNGPFNLPESETTVASILRSAGYRTALIGKSCVSGNTQDADMLTKHGFDLFYGTTDHKDAHHRYPKFLYENTRRMDFPDNHLHYGSHYDLDLYTKRSLEWLDGQSTDQPFFLLLSIPVPHASIILPEEKVNGSPVHYTKVADPKQSYIGLMKRIDETISMVVGKIDSKGLRDNTLIIFTSDNGPHSEGGYQPKMIQSAGPLRGQKRDLYEGGIRVPMIANWPKVIAPGRTTSHPSAFWDFMPTVCDILEIDAPSGIQGISYLPTLRGMGGQTTHDALYWESHENNGRRALRSGDWKIVQYDLMKMKPGPYELYQISSDISESKNVAAEHPEVVANLSAKLDAARAPSALFPFPALDQR